MSNVYNRKMFKRNARKALDSAAGVPPVQMFQVGGLVSNPGQGYQTFTSPLTGKTYRGAIPSGRGVTSLQPFDIATRYIQGGRTVGYGSDDAISPGEYAVLQAYQSANQAGRSVKDPTDTRIGSVLEGVLNPAAKVAAGGGAFVRGLTTQGLQSLLSSDKEGTDTFGQRVASMKPGALDSDFLASLNIFEIDPSATSTAAGPQPKAAPRGIFQGPMPAPAPIGDSPAALERIRAEQEARRQMAEQGIVVSDEETGAMPPSTAEMEAAADNIMRDREAAESAYQAAVDAADRDEATVDLSKMGTTGRSDGTSGTSGTTGTGDPSETGTTGTVPSTKEEIENVINNGNQADEESALDGFIKEFMDKAPGYEGADSGLILAKIGFAMAAGKSPNAIENIASAMSDGADMLIKDKAKKDEFNRQLKLSAMQYGLGEVGKLRAEDRLAAREGRKLNYFVAEKDVTIGDRTYGKGETVPVTTEFIRDNGLPSGLQTPEMAKAAITANSAYQKALAQAQKDKIIDAKTYTGLVEKMNVATTDFVRANQLRELVQGNIVRNAEGKITGVGPAFQQLVNRAYNAAGVDAGKDYESVEKFNQDMRRVSNLLLKDLLGECSKNVSNIDRKLADEIVGLYANYGGYIFQDEDLLNERLQNVLATLERKEQNALNIFRGTLDSTDGLTFASGKAVTFNVPQAAQDALYGAQASKPTYELQDGVYRRIGVKQSNRIT